VSVSPDIEAYFSFVMGMFLAFGLTFEVPIIVVLLVRFGIASIEKLKQAARDVILSLREQLSTRMVEVARTCLAAEFNGPRLADVIAAVIGIFAQRGEAAGGIEKEKVRRAGSAVGLGHGLRFIIQKWEREPGSARHRGGRRGCILRVVRHVIGGDCDQRHALSRVVSREPRQLGLHMHDIRAMRAQEHHEQRIFSREIRERKDAPAGNIGKRKRRRGSAQREHGGRDGHWKKPGGSVRLAGKSGAQTDTQCVGASGWSHGSDRGGGFGTGPS
jgi:hypothetical protein